MPRPGCDGGEWLHHIVLPNLESLPGERSFDADAAQAAGLPVGIGTEGGSTSFSVIRTLHEAHSAGCAGSILTRCGFYLATLVARALGLDGEVGNFETGIRELVLLDKSSTPLIARRMQALR
jgi:cytosine/adenosine deaminase-related metal-dependent hydrolase